jgi:hypothetical protein
LILELLISAAVSAGVALLIVSRPKTTGRRLQRRPAPRHGQTRPRSVVDQAAEEYKSVLHHALYPPRPAGDDYPTQRLEFPQMTTEEYPVASAVRPYLMATTDTPEGMMPTA